MIKSASKHLVDRQPHRVGDLPPEALIAFVKDASEPDASPVSDRALRAQLAPLADWIEIDLASITRSQNEDLLRSELSKALHLRQMRSEQLVILGWRNAARIALDLVLKRVVSCCGIIAVDLLYTSPCDPISATSASVRIVSHDSKNNMAHAKLVDALRRQDADFRVMTLPSGGAQARDITTRATAAFLSELTANACRRSA
jgi:hypothetical protein